MIKEINKKEVNKDKLAELVYQECKDQNTFNNIPSKQNIKKIIDKVFNNITNLLSQQETVFILGFGKFMTRYTKEREIRSVKDRTKKIQISSKYNAKFRPSKILSKLIDDANSKDK